MDDVFSSALIYSLEIICLPLLKNIDYENKVIFEAH